MPIRELRNWHRKRAQALCDQLPEDIDDAIKVLGLMVAELTWAANSVDLSDLSTALGLQL